MAIPEVTIPPGWPSTTRCSSSSRRWRPSASGRPRRWRRSCSRGGAQGKRTALPNARILIHQPMGGTQGQATDIKIQAEEILRMREHLNGILSKHTGQPLERIAADTERDYYMSACLL